MFGQKTKKEESIQEPISLLYIFGVFLKLGCTAFGGYMSLVAMVQKQLVEIDKRLKEEDLLDGISLTSMLPGPVAVNIIAYVGYRLRGIKGAILAFLGIIIPSFFLVLLLSWMYKTYGSLPVVKNFFLGITLAITALILTVAMGMAKKNMKEPSQWIIGFVSMCLLIFIGGIVTTFFIIIGSGIVGYVLFHKRQQVVAANIERQGDKMSPKQWAWSAIIGLLLLSLLLFGGQNMGNILPLQIASTFSGISLTLFGGGYVVIPTLHELFVDNLGWLTSSEFADGIAIGQITPGPIFITATFIGYHVAGITGAIIATISIFTPPAVLTVLLSRSVDVVRNSSVMKSVLLGIRPAVIGMIFASAYTIGKTMDMEIKSILVFLILFYVSYKFKISPIILILGSGVLGLILYL